jgi:Glycosyl hydrolase family 9
MHAAHRYAGLSLMSTIVKSGSSPSDFVQLAGVGDSSVFAVSTTPSWQLPAKFSDKCFFATASKPAADIAGQTAAALALLSRVFKAYGTTGEKAVGGLADQLLAQADVAYKAAADAFVKRGDNSSCSRSGANKQCIGDCPLNVDGVRCLPLVSGEPSSTTGGVRELPPQA